jgi:hypothetical protein
MLFAVNISFLSTYKKPNTFTDKVRFPVNSGQILQHIKMFLFSFHGYNRSSYNSDIQE